MSQADGLYVVRLYDGFDNEWINVSGHVSADEAERIWNELTKNGTEKTKYDDIDYYRVFPADTAMLHTAENHSIIANMYKEQSATPVSPVVIPANTLILNRKQTFTEYDNEITTRGVDYSGKIIKKHELGDYQIWHKRSGSCFGGIGRQVYAAPWLVLVKTQAIPGVGNYRDAIEIEGKEVGRKDSRSYERYLVAKMEELAGAEK